jgi:hypothetical protein
MSRRIAVWLLAVAAALAAWWLLQRGDGSARPEDPQRPREAARRAIDAGPVVAAPPSMVPAAVGYRRLDPAARRALRERIARARSLGQASVAAAETAAPPPLPGTLEADQVLQGILPLVPALKDCYREGRAARSVSRVRVRFSLQLVGEPDVGTLIDAVELDGDEAFRADRDLQTCLRETLLAVELPPLSGGSSAAFVTTLVLADDPPATAADTGPDAGPGSR